MKNYNGSHLSPSHTLHSSSAKSISSHPLINSAKTPGSSDEPFTLHDLKQEYSKALNFIDKLKAEQNSIKNNLRMALDQKAQPPSPDRSTPSQNIPKRNAMKEINDKRIMELEIENSELRAQVDTAMVRVSKLQREKQALHDKLLDNDSQVSSNRELVGELRSLTQEIKTLKIRLEEVEEENIRLSKQQQKSSGRSVQRPSQNLLRYVNYVAKLVSTMPGSSFARSCYEERFPRENDAGELLESGQWEPVLLKSYKYITDLLINLNSLSTEEGSYRNLETPVESGSQVHSRYASRRDSPTSGKDSIVADGYSKRIQPVQEGFRPQKLRMEALDVVSPSKSLTVREEDLGYAGNEGTHPAEYEHSKRNLQKIISGIDESKGYKKPQKRHVRHYSSVIGGYAGGHMQDTLGVESSVAENASATRGINNWESRVGSRSGYSPVEENNYSVKTRRLRDEAEARKSEDEAPENHPKLKVKPAKAERQVREEYEEEDSVKESRGNKRNRQGGRKDQYREVEVHTEEADEGEEVYRSEFVKSRVAAAAVKGQKEDNRRDLKREEENDRRIQDDYGQIKKRNRERREEKATADEYKSNIKRREINLEDRSRSPSLKEGETYESEGNEQVYRSQRPQDNSTAKIRNKIQNAQNVQSDREVDSFYRSRSMPKNVEIIEETQESENTSDNNKNARRREIKHINHRTEENEADPSDKNQLMWDRKREELAKINKKGGNNVSVNTSMELKGQDYTTFSVSFGRTESKSKLNLSPSPKAASGLMDIPRRKRVDYSREKYDVITGRDLGMLSPQTTKAERSPTVRFCDGEGKKLSTKKSGSMVDLGADFDKAK